MAISPEQIKEIKKQLVNQINSTFPEDKKKDSIEKIESMNDSEVMQFLEENNMIRDADSSKENPQSECIFCSIISGGIPSTKIAEDENSVAILEINPLSEGHTMIIPKKHLTPAPKETEDFAKKIKEKLKNSLNAKDILIEHSELFGHAIVNLIPVYGEELKTERKKATPEELKKIIEKINYPEEQKHETKEEIKKETISEEKLIIPKRIP